MRWFGFIVYILDLRFDSHINATLEPITRHSKQSVIYHTIHCIAIYNKRRVIVCCQCVGPSYQAVLISYICSLRSLILCLPSFFRKFWSRCHQPQRQTKSERLFSEVQEHYLKTLNVANPLLPCGDIYLKSV